MYFIRPIDAACPDGKPMVLVISGDGTHAARIKSFRKVIDQIVAVVVRVGMLS